MVTVHVEDLQVLIDHGLNTSLGCDVASELRLYLWVHFVNNEK